MSDPSAIFQWRRIDRRVTSSGQPSDAQLGELAAIGVTDIVNLGLHSHERALPDEAASVAERGMDYHYLPVAFDDPRPDDYARFCALMQRLAGRTVHVHCIANLRVSAFFYRYRRDQGVVSDAAARAEMESVWKPGGVWAEFIGDDAAIALPHRYAGRDY